MLSSRKLTYLGGVDDLIGEGLRDRLERPEGGLAGTLADQVNGLVDSAEGRHVDSLSAHDTARTDTGGVFTGAGGSDGVDENLAHV